MIRILQRTTGTALRKVINSAANSNIRCLSSFTSTVKVPEVVVNKSTAKAVTSDTADQKILKENCGTTTPDDELEELEEMFIMGPAGIEWNGPTRGGARPEPTRYKDWERKGRCTDF